MECPCRGRSGYGLSLEEGLLQQFSVCDLAAGGKTEPKEQVWLIHANRQSRLGFWSHIPTMYTYSGRVWHDLGTQPVSWVLSLECWTPSTQGHLLVVWLWANSLGSIPGSGGLPGGGHGSPLQFSCLENSMDRRAWWATVHGVTELNTTEHTAG